jgi:hypothetical protein
LSLASSPLRFPRSSHSLFYSHHLLLLLFLFVQIAEMAIDKVDAKEREKIEAVRKLLRKQAPLSAKQVMPENQLCFAYYIPISASVRFFIELVVWLAMAATSRRSTATTRAWSGSCGRGGRASRRRRST